jgi:integrase
MKGRAMAHVEKRMRGGTLRWRARYRSPDGRERSRSFARRTDAEQFLAQVEVDKAHGTWIDPTRAQLPFGEWAERWLGTTTHLKPKTRAGYESMLRSRLLPAFGRAPLGEIRPIDVREWLSGMQARGLSASSCRQAYHLLAAIMRTAVEDGRLAASPCSGVKLPRLPQVEMAYLEPHQLRDLLAVVDPQYELFVEVLAIGGLRFGEAAALRRSRCDLLRSRLMVAESLSDASGTLYFGPPKTHQRRTVTLPRFLRDRLGAHLSGVEGEDELVFQAPRGGPIRYSNFARRIWKPALLEAGLPDMGVHALRHTCAALLIAQGAHPKAIQSHLGHRSITTTLDRYGHLFEDEHEKLAERIDAAYAQLLDEKPNTPHAVEPIRSAS